MDIESLGMKKSLLYETVISTVNSDKTANAAPIGIICKDKNTVVCYLHRGSSTVQNIKTNKKFIVNIINDPMVFVESTIGNLPESCYATHEDEFYIKNSDAYFQAKVISIKDVEKEDQFGVSVTSVVIAKVSDIFKRKNALNH